MTYLFIIDTYIKIKKENVKMLNNNKRKMNIKLSINEFMKYFKEYKQSIHLVIELE